MKKKKEPKIINEEKKIKYLRSLISRTLTVIVIFLILAIISKGNRTYKDLIVNNLYEKNISFTKVKNLYNKYLGGIIPLEKVTPEVTPVFNEKLEYTNESIYYDGVKLEVIDNYLVPIIEEGMVIYIGEKENYGNVIIIEGINGIEIWYGNIESATVKLYDYVEKGNYLGATKNNYLYLAYSKDGKFLDYKEHLKWK